MHAYLAKRYDPKPLSLKEDVDHHCPLGIFSTSYLGVLGCDSLKCQVAEGRQSLKDITMELAAATLVVRLRCAMDNGQAMKLPQNCHKIRFHIMLHT